MGLSVALSNALSGMRAGTSSLDVLSRNVANSGVHGYHRQSISVIDTQGINSSYVRSGEITRAFNQSLQQQYSRSISESGFTSVRASFVDRLQTVIGKPGASGSLDTVYAAFQQALSAVAVSPDNYAVRADAVAKAQVLASTLNDLSSQVQTLRRESESKITTSVDDLNQVLKTLETLNSRLANGGTDPGSRAVLLDQRDRLVTQVAQVIDVRVSYRENGTISIMTRSGVGLLDDKASVLEFQSAGALSATSQLSSDPTQNQVGKLIIRTPAGFALDAVEQNVIRGGELGALLDMRDKALVTAQDQLDEIAASLAMAMSTVDTAGTVASSGGRDGLAVDIAGVRSGNEVTLNYTQAGIAKTLRVVRVDDTSKLPMDTTDSNGNRVIGVDFSGGAASIAAQVQSALGGSFQVSGTGSTLTVLDDGAAGTTEITALTAHGTVGATQGAGLGLSLFVDAGNADFSNSLDGIGQLRGFAARISVNDDILDNMSLLVQYQAGGSLGDDDRADYLLDRLDNMRFASFDPSGRTAAYRMAGTVTDYITQMVNYQGNVAANALSDADTQELTMQTLVDRMDSEYGVDVDEEMARLMELQNAYAANARVLSSIQDLLNQLMQI
jgi:flagellar hook-associated protein 1 FlgK